MQLTPKQSAQLCSLIMEALSGQSPPRSALEALEAQLATASKSDGALDGVRQMISASAMLPRERRSKIDSWLAANSLPPLDTLSEQFDSREESLIATVLSRGRILEDEECGAVMDALKDMTADLSDEDRIALGDMINRFYGR